MSEKLIYGNDGNRWPETDKAEANNSWAETLAKMDARVAEAKAENKKNAEVDQALREFQETHAAQISKKNLRRALADEINVLRSKLGDANAKLKEKDIQVDLAELRVRDMRRELDKAHAVINAYKSKYGDYR